MRPLKIVLSMLAIPVVFSSSVTVNAQDIVYLLGNQFGVGARAMGMGGAFIAVADDYSAVHWNPAGLGQIRRMEAFGSLSHLIFRDDADFFGTTTSNEPTSFTKLNAAGFVYPVPTYRGSLVFALGFNRVKSFDSSLSLAGFNSSPEDSVYQAGEEYETGGLNTWSLAGAVQVTPDVFVGGAINFWSGSEEYNWKLSEKDVLDIYTFRSGSIEDNYTTKFSAANLTLGALVTGGRTVRVGAVISTPITFQGKENWRLYDATTFDDNTYTDTTEVGYYEYKIRSPFSLGVGASIALPNLLVSGDVEFNDWSQTKYISPSEMLSENSNIRKGYRSTVRYRLGAELVIPEVGFKIRGGYFIDPLPNRKEHIRTDKHFITGGLGFLINRQFTIDIAWTRGWWERYSEGLNLTEKIEVDKFFITSAFRL